MDSLAACHSSRKSVVLRSLAERGVMPEPVARLMYLLGTFRDPERVNPSQIWIARKLRCTVEWVRRVTRRAEELGVLEVEARPGRRTRRYRVKWSAVDEMARGIMRRAAVAVARALGGTKTESWGIVKTCSPQVSSVPEVPVPNERSEDRRQEPPREPAKTRLPRSGRARPKGEFLFPEAAAPKPRRKPAPKRPGFDAFRLYFCERWSGRFNGAQYPWAWKRDGFQMARIYDAVGGDFERYKGLVVHYLMIDTKSHGARWSATRGYDVTAMACRIAELIAA